MRTDERDRPFSDPEGLRLLTTTGLVAASGALETGLSLRAAGFGGHRRMINAIGATK